MVSKPPRFAFVDAEYTGEHQRTTLISLAVVGWGAEQIYLTFNEYDREQVTPWVSDNVLAHINSSGSVSYKDGFLKLSAWFDAYAGDEQVSLVSVGKTHDLVLLFELWHHAHPDKKYFHNLHCLPSYLNHGAHFDLPTIFWLAGLSPDLDREAFINGAVSGRKHEALFDALVARECFRACVTSGNFPNARLA